MNYNVGGKVHYDQNRGQAIKFRSNMTQRDEVQKFEHQRIKVLQEERLHIQKKTFTKWMNSFLQKARMEVEDLFEDLADGRKLLKLLEIISGEKLARPNNGRMRVHKIENVNKSLAFLHTKVRLESIGAEDIVDGNPRLILGLIWTIILRFQIQEIEIDVDEENESSEKKSAKDALLLWAQRKTQGYPGVQINDFTNSWRSGLGFNALIHAHRPDLFNYNDLHPQKHIDNLNHAFDVANNELGIPRLLDAEDIDTNRPDEKSIMTYVASYYHTFARMKNEAKSGRRIEKIIKQISEADKMKLTYDTLTTDLLEWIQRKVMELEDRNFPNSLEGIQHLLVDFGQYRTREKPPKYKERSEIEALFFNINTQLKELRQPTFTPSDGKLLQDIHRAWDQLERAEHSREVALRSELRRQERLEQINYKFTKKSILRENYLKEMIQVLSDPIYGSNLAKVDATVKKHEAISADIYAREERIHDLTQMCEELQKENYRFSDRVKKREEEVLLKWKEVLALLDKHKFALNQMGNAMSLLREIETTLTTIYQLKSNVSSVDTGGHLLAVEELLHKHALQELQVTSIGETERRLKRLGEQMALQRPKEEEILKKKLEELATAYKELQDDCANRKALLEDARNFYQFIQDQEEEEAWLLEKQRICLAGVTAKDLAGVLRLQQKHKLFLDEIKTRKNKFDQLGKSGKHLLQENHPRAEEIKQHMETNREEWAKLEKLATERTKKLQDAAEAYQFYADANEADSFLQEKKSILSSKDYGSDEPSAQALLQRHRDLQGELNAYNGDIQSLNNQAERLISAGISNLDLTAELEVAGEPIEEIVYENKLVPMEVIEDEPIEKIEHRTVLQERKVPQVKALYPFNDHGLSMAKGEVMYLLNKSNPDWWCVRKADGTDGFAPANYVQEIEPRIIQMKVNKPEKVKVMQKVKKTKMVMQKVPVKVMKAPKELKRKVDDSNNVPKRQQMINNTYQECQVMANKRHALLEDAIRLFRFYRECDDFERWMKDKEKMLTSEADPNQNVEQALRKHKKFVTDLSASSKRLDAIQAEVKEFEKQNHSQMDKVRARYRQITNAWEELNKLRALKEKSLEGASIVEIFIGTCDEAKERMNEKLTHLDVEVSGHDLKTVQALQRRHEQLERDIAPIEKTVHEIGMLAQSVVKSNPNEKANVAKRMDEITALWAQVKNKALDRRAGLEDAVGQQIFTNSAKALIHWVGDVKNQLNAECTARDVQTAEGLLKNHNDLYHDIQAHDDEFRQVTDLGKKLLKSNPNLKDVSDNLNRLAEEQAAIDRGWKEKHHWLKQCLQLQKFNKEADKIDAATSSHQAFLEFSDLGNSLDEVEALLKQHRSFENTLVAQDTGLIAFDKKADALIAEKHYESQGINDKRNHVLQRRATVKDLSQNRAHALEASKNYQEFCAEVSDLRSWLNEKLKTASDESYRDLSNLERKLQKHEAFERELRANEGQLRSVNKMGQALIAHDGYRKDDVAKSLKDLNDEWQKLVGISLDKGRKLRQAQTQHSYNTAVEDVKAKLDEIENELKNSQVGNDMRSCKDLLKKHDLLENELQQCSVRVRELVDQSDEMAHDDHFDSAAVKNGALLSQKRLEKLDTPAKKRREALEEALEYHKFNFELNNELQWIKEHLPQASSTVLGQNLHQAQNLCKKHKKLENEITGHQPVIDKTLESGQHLIDKNHPEKKMVKDLCENLKSSWKDLNEKAAERAHKLEQSLKAQQYIFEANEVESWLNEKKDVLSGTDYGRDRDAATKLLTKHKALELELDTYSSIIAEMGRGAQALIQSGHPESKAIAERQSTLEHLVRSLQRKAALRQHRLMESLFRHEYFLESEELEHWIIEQQQQASSEDYGQDYEHLLLLEAKFDDFKHRIEAGSERFKQCEALAQKLIANESPYTSDIELKQQQLEERWANLKDQINNREKKLIAAAKIHRFHRDVSDALSRIHFKTASLGNELGRDLNSALALLRKQEAFENELVVLEAQLQVLVDDASKLIVIYPSNKANIQEKQDSIVKAWQKLKDATEDRRDKLQASVDLQKFLSQVRDLTNWAIETRLAVSAEEVVRNATRAQALKGEHDALKGEIDAREESFRAIAEMATAMDQTDHYAAAEAVEKCNALFKEHEKLHSAWQMKKVYLDQLIDLHIFLREAKQLEDISNAQEAALMHVDCGETVEEVDRQLKKHDEFEKVLNTQDEKFDTLFSTGEKLRSQKHFDSATIGKRLVEVQSKREKVKHLCLAKRHQLEHAILYATFMRDVADVKNWIAEKEKKLQAEIKLGEVSNLEDKIKMLQKHQAFEAEIAAHLGRVDEVKDQGETLIKRKHKASQDIAKQLTELDAAWMRLVNEIEFRGKGLEEAQDILGFNNQLEKIESWIRDKEVMVQAADTGRDYEHCQALQRKLDDVDSDMRVDDTRIRIIDKLAEKLIKQGHPGVKERRDNFLSKWKRLQGELNDYRNKLSGAAEVHHFNRDVADTCQRINEKMAGMESDDLGRDLAGVEALQRKQEVAEMEMTAVEKKIQEHDRESYKLSQKYPHTAQSITDKMEDLQKQWIRLLDVKKKRKNALDLAYRKQKFLSDTKDLETWCNEMIKRMEARNKPNSVAEADAQLEFHNELKVEINGRSEEFRKLIDLGKEIARDDPQVMEAVNKLTEMQANLLSMWDKHLQDLSHECQLQEFKEHADQLDAWMASKEAFLNNDDMGENPRAVEALIRKHQDFEAMLEQQLTRVGDLEDAAARICENKKYDNSEVENRLKSILNRKNNLIKSANDRKKLLEESKALYEFLRNMHEVENWLAQKIQVASDDNYQDPSNLQSKIQRHTAFEAEILKNTDLIQSVLNNGQVLIENKHFASNQIGKQLDNLEADWKFLQETSQLKKDRLNDAYQALLFNRSMDEFEAWLSEVEIQLQSNDYGKDLVSVNNLLKKHTILENDIQQHRENCEAIHENSEIFTKNGHFMAYDLQERAQDAITRYHQLQGPMQARRDLLEASNMLQQFTRDVDDELQWLADREPLVASKDLGNSLTTVQSLQKKHQALESELISREAIVGGLISRATQLTRSGHHAANLINDKAAQVKTKLNDIRDLASIRRLRLQDALEAQLYYAEAAEAEAWYNDKKPLLESGEIGRDEDSTQSLQRKLEALGCEIEAYKAVIHKLSVMSSGLIERNHYDLENIKKKQENIEMKFRQLQNLFAERETRLSEALLYFIFIRECTEVSEWMTDQQAKADSEDYGTDVEHVELLIQAFETFFVSLTNSKARVLNCIEEGNKIAQNSPHTEKVLQKVEEIRTEWEDLVELAQARKDALAGAKQVHMFDRTADETITWIQEKEAILGLDNYDQDLESIQALVRKHIAFESELLAVQEQVDCVEDEAAKLIEMYPDAEEHIQVKRRDAQEAWQSLQKAAEGRKKNLQQAEHLQTYYDEHQKLLAWINEMLAKITAPELPQDVTAAELLIERHKEHKVEIDARADVFKQFFTTGNRLIKQGHFLSNEIDSKIRVLDHRYDLLLRTWDSRNRIYEQNLDVQLFKREANTLENWLIVREGTLRDGKVGETINQVEDLIRKHEDFENTIRAQEDKFAALKRITLLEEAFILQKEFEAKAKKAERERIEQERLENRKRKEMQRITESRRQEDNDWVPEVNGNSNNKYLQVENKEDPANALTPATSLTKSNSVAHMFSDRIRRVSEGSVKRAESMKVQGPVRIPKRTPSFTTRRRGSFRNRPAGQESEIQPLVEMEGFLDRKQVLNSGGRKAQNRTWKNLYTVLCGQLLCFFKNRDDFIASKALYPPMGIHNAMCSVADDYSKKRYTFRLISSDQSEYLFACLNETDMEAWVHKISFRAKLPPSQQLLHFEVQKQDFHDVELSSQSSRTSSPDVTDNVVLRHDPQYSNGNSQSSRHSISGYPSGEARLDWSSNRPVSQNLAERKSSRIMDLFRKRRQPSSHI